jgi:hypothetical protein
LVTESSLSLLGFKRRLEQQGIGEGDLTQAEQTYQDAREKLRSLEGGVWKGMRKRIRSGAWKQDWYYFDPRKEYETSGIRPGRENRLDQGRENAEEAFVQRDDFIRVAEQSIERDIVDMGNQAAIAKLDAHITAHKQSLSKMALENELRSQYEKEVRAVEAKQRQLGRISPELELVAA